MSSQASDLATLKTKSSKRTSINMAKVWANTLVTQSKPMLHRRENKKCKTELDKCLTPFLFTIKFLAYLTYTNLFGVDSSASNVNPSSLKASNCFTSITCSRIAKPTNNPRPFLEVVECCFNFPSLRS